MMKYAPLSLNRSGSDSEHDGDGSFPLPSNDTNSLTSTVINDRLHHDDSNNHRPEYEYFANLCWLTGCICSCNKSFLSQMAASFDSLKSCPRELYVNFGLKFCESYNYFAMSQILVIYLHNEFHLTDMQAGACYGMWGASITFWGLLTSFINDNLGVRRSLLVGFSISAISTFIIASTTNLTVLYMTLFGLLPLGTSMGIPMLTVGIRRYTNASNRGFAFGLYYSVMNIAAFVSGPIVDVLNIGLKDGIDIFGQHWSSNRLVILTASGICVCSLILTYTSLREIRVKEDVDPNISHQTIEIDETNKVKISNLSNNHQFEGLSYGNDDNKSEHSDNPLLMKDEEITTIISTPDSHALSSSLDIEIGNDQNDLQTIPIEQDDTPPTAEEYQPEQKSLVTTISELSKSATFWRFSLFTLFLINLNAVFRHLDATLPTFLVRVFGPSTPKGMIYSINPLIIIFLTPFVAAFTNKYAHYDMIKYGGYITAASPFFLVASVSIWATICMVIMLSIGEAIWSPRTYDYMMSVAPQGREASFAALSAAPLFAAKIPVGLMSGYLLSKYVPENGDTHNCYMLWLVVGLMTMTSPILITLLEKCIREKPSHSPRTNLRD